MPLLPVDLIYSGAANFLRIILDSTKSQFEPKEITSHQELL